MNTENATTSTPVEPIVRRRDFIFGVTKARGVFAGEQNPHRDGLFVEHIRRTGRLNPGRFVRLTNGAGEFWEYEMDAVVIWGDGESEEDVNRRADVLRESLRVVRGLNR